MSKQDQVKEFSLKTPALSTAGDNFQGYLKDVSYWNELTQVAASRRAMTLFLQLSGDAKLACEHLPKDELKNDRDTPADDVGLPGDSLPAGVCLLLKTLRNAGFAPLQTTEPISRTMDLMTFKRTNDMKMAVYTSGFSARRVKAAAHKTVLDEMTAAMLMLTNATIDPAHHVGILSTIKKDKDGKFTVEDMTTTLCSTFGNGKVQASSITQEEIHFTAGDEYYDLEDSVDSDLIEVPASLVGLDQNGVPTLVEQSILLAPHWMHRGGYRSGRGYYHGRGNSGWRGGRGSGFNRGRGMPGHQEPTTFNSSSGQRPGSDVESRVVCYNCGIRGHFARNCPVNTPSSYGISECFLTSNHTTSTSNELVLDIGATMSVVGSATLARLQDLNPSLNFPQVHFRARFSFGGNIKESEKAVDIPVLFGDQHHLLRFAVIPDQGGYSLPFLVSLSALTVLGAIIDLQSKPPRITLCGNLLEVYVNPANHLAIPLTLHHQLLDRSREYYPIQLVSNAEQIDPELRKAIVKLHISYGHPSPDKLIKFLLRSSWQHLISKTVVNWIRSHNASCLTCVKATRPQSVSKVCIPLSSKWNEVVGIDIMTWNGTQFLKIIDLFTRFMRIFVLKSHSHSEIIRTVRRGWIANYGRFRSLFSDREFLGEDMAEFQEAAGILSLVSAAQSPESNAICERHGGMIKEVMSKMKVENPSMALDVLVDAAVEAHKTLANVDGFSPHQLVFGENPPVPSILSGHLSQCEAITATPPSTSAERINAVLAGRAAFVIVEADSRIHRALALKVNNKIPIIFSPGQLVFFFNDDTAKSRRGWFGPAKVIGVDPEAKTAYLFYNRNYYTRHFSKVVLVPGQQVSTTQQTMQTNSSIPPATPEQKLSGPPVFEAQIPEEAPTTQQSDSESGSSSSESEFESEQSGPGVVESSSSESEGQSPVALAPRRKMTEIEKLNSTKLRQWGGDVNELRHLIHQEQHRRNTTNPWEINLIHEIEVQMEVLMCSPDFILVANHEVNKLASMQGHLWDGAKQRELRMFSEYQVVEQMEISEFTRRYPKGQLVDSKWVLTMKEVLPESTNPSAMSSKSANLPPKVQVPKARLVARGFQEDVTDELTDAPTATKEALRLVAFLAAQKKWSIASIDIRTAFLQSDVRSPNEPAIGIIPPPEAEVPSGTIWFLKKSMYGLRSAPKSWYMTLMRELKSNGFTQCVHDPALFTLVNDGVFHGALCVHVDDLFLSGDAIFHTRINDLQRRFTIGTYRRDRFVHCGLEFSTGEDGSIHMSQKKYIEKLEFVDITADHQANRPLDDPLNEQEKTRFRGIVGCLLWVSSSTRADIAVDVSKLSGMFQSATFSNLLMANKVLRYLKGSADVEIVYRPLASNKTRVISFSDAAFQNMPNSKSQGGQYIVIAEDTEQTIPSVTWTPVAPISWQSQRLKRVVKSTLSAEVLSSSLAFDQAWWIRGLHDEIVSGRSAAHTTPLDLKTDCESFVTHVKSLRNHPTEKRLVGEINMMRESITRGEIRSLQHVPTEFMIADGLTKDHHRLRKAIINAGQGNLKLAENGVKVQASHLLS